MEPYENSKNFGIVWGFFSRGEQRHVKSLRDNDRVPCCVKGEDKKKKKPKLNKENNKHRINSSWLTKLSSNNRQAITFQRAAKLEHKLHVPTGVGASGGTSITVPAGWTEFIISTITICQSLNMSVMTTVGIKNERKKQINKSRLHNAWTWCQLTQQQFNYTHQRRATLSLPSQMSASECQIY